MVLILQPNRSRPEVDGPLEVIHSAEPQYTKEARHQKIEGLVPVETLITEEGLPTKIRVTKSLHYGL